MSNVSTASPAQCEADTIILTKSTFNKLLGPLLSWEQFKLAVEQANGREAEAEEETLLDPCFNDLRSSIESIIISVHRDRVERDGMGFPQSKEKRDELTHLTLSAVSLATVVLGMLFLRANGEIGQSNKGQTSWSAGSCVSITDGNCIDMSQRRVVQELVRFILQVRNEAINDKVVIGVANTVDEIVNWAMNQNAFAAHFASGIWTLRSMPVDVIITIIGHGCEFAKATDSSEALKEMSPQVFTFLEELPAQMLATAEAMGLHDFAGLDVEGSKVEISQAQCSVQ